MIMLIRSYSASNANNGVIVPDSAIIGNTRVAGEATSVASYLNSLITKIISIAKNK